MKTILVELDPDIRDGRLDCAADLARAFGSHIIGLQVTPASAYVGFDPFGGVYALPAVLEALAEREQKTRSIFEAEMAKEGVSWEYRQIDGAPSGVLAEISRVVDLVLVAKPGGREKRVERLSHVGDIAMSSSAPVLAIPAGTSAFDPFGKALIAWNGSPEAANAVRGALPMLTLASEVTLLTAEEPGGKWELPATGIAEYLSRHGVHAVIETVTVTNGDIPYSLLFDVADREPSYLVMGAYGRSPTREWLLGGVTRRMILDLPAPLFLAH